MVLSDLGIMAGQTVQVEIQSSDPVNKPLHLKQPSQTYKLPDKIKVKVELGKIDSCFCSIPTMKMNFQCY